MARGSQRRAVAKGASARLGWAGSARGTQHGWWGGLFLGPASGVLTGTSGEGSEKSYKKDLRAGNLPGRDRLKELSGFSVSAQRRVRRAVIPASGYLPREEISESRGLCAPPGGKGRARPTAEARLMQAGNKVQILDEEN